MRFALSTNHGGGVNVEETALNHESRLARIEALLEALNKRMDDAILTQLKDHGKRIAILERRQAWQIGWMAGAGAVGAMVGKFFL